MREDRGAEGLELVNDYVMRGHRVAFLGCKREFGDKKATQEISRLVANLGLREVDDKKLLAG